MGIDQPNCTEGQWILGEAELFSFALADTAWQGLQVQIFSHTCPILFDQARRADRRGLSRLSESARAEDVGSVRVGEVE